MSCIRRKVRTGQVVSDRMNKTVVVVVETSRHHPFYKKLVKHNKKYKAHDENDACKIGDKVKIMETRPLSKEKRWRVVEIISKREVAEAEPEVNNDPSLYQTQSS
jgi:small subunit ribosomal protein S17